MSKLVVFLLGCAALFAPLSSTAQKVEKNKKPATPDYTIYSKKDDLFAKVRQVVAENTGSMMIEMRPAGADEYKVDMMVVHVEPGGRTTNHQDKVRLMMDFGEHGREYITSELALAFLRVINQPDRIAQLIGEGAAKRLSQHLNKVVMKVIPMENVHGRTKVEAGSYCERKNGRGVDTNRNWDIDWGKKEADYDPNEEFPGAAPHSEPEVKVLLGLAKEFVPHVWLNVHSGMEALFTPYDHKAVIPDGPLAITALNMMKVINQRSCGGRCAIGSGGKSVGYLAHGTATDYMYEVLKVPMSFTWEVYGDLDAPYDDCFRMFNPLTREVFDQTITSWLSALLTLLELLPIHPATPLHNGRYVCSVPEFRAVFENSTGIASGEAVFSCDDVSTAPQRKSRDKLLLQPQVSYVTNSHASYSLVILFCGLAVMYLLLGYRSRAGPGVAHKIVQ